MEPGALAQLPGDRETECLSALTSHFKGMGPRLLRKTFLGYRLSRGLSNL